jgi:hypothetical protein
MNIYYLTVNKIVKLNVALAAKDVKKKSMCINIKQYMKLKYLKVTFFAWLLENKNNYVV